MKARTFIALLAMPLAVGCAELTKEEVPYFKAVSGEAAVKALGSTLSEVLSELGTVLSQTNSGISTPSQVNPPKELFEEEEDKAAAAPGFRPASHEENHLSEWKGPEVGPDGVAGWYYREATAQVWSWSDSKYIEAKWRYWLRFEPAYDITAGVKGAKPTHTNYAWSTEAGPWVGWKYIIRFGVTKTDVNMDGSVRPKAVEGTWLWEIDSKATQYKGSKSEGEYSYVLGHPEELLEGDAEEEEDLNGDPFFGIKTGGKRTVSFAGSGRWSYTGNHSDAQNKPMGSWFGLGEREMSGAAVVSRPNQSDLDAEIQFTYEYRGLWGQGQRPANLDLSTPPAFSAAVTPAGTEWGVPKWAAIYDKKLTERDGILGYWEATGEIQAQNTWDATKAQDARKKIKAANEVLEDPTATESARTKAYEDLHKGWEEYEDAYSKRDYVNRYQDRSLTWDGKEDKRDDVYCSDQKLASDCPKPEDQKN